MPHTQRVMLQIADAVGEAQRHGIVHRDLKPENVMLVQRDEDSDFVKVLDFGVARAAGEDPALAAPVVKRAGAVFACARDVAPECAAGANCSAQSDVYALAALGNECLTGSTPLAGDNAIAVLLKQQSQAVPGTRDSRSNSAYSARERFLTRSPLPRLVGLACGALTALAHLTAHAQNAAPETPARTEPADPRLARGFLRLSRPQGIAELGVGWLTLPGAAVCAERSSGSGCKKGDTSFELDAWQLYRANKRFAVGAGLLLGLIPTSDAPRNDPEGVTRSHKRSYLTLEATIRHYPYVGESVELWWGVAGGLAVVSDRFEVSDKNSNLALVGSHGVTIRTEGASIGLAGGAVFWLADHWSLGTTFRYGNWFLPKIAAKDPLTDEASLTGRNTMFSLGISIAYRIPL